MRKAKDCSKYTQRYVDAVIAAIKAREGAIPDEYEIFLDLLAYNVNLYELAQNDCVERGTCLTYNDKTYTNPSYNVMRDCEKQIHEISKKFGLDAYSKTKITDTNNKNEEDLDEYLDSLTK